MKVTLVRQAGCTVACAEWIAAQGMIDEDTLPRLRRVIGQLDGRKVPVLIDSGGGLVDDSIAIGQLIRAKGLDVVVAKTVLTGCPPGEVACTGAGKGVVRAGTPDFKAAKCASSCAFVLAGGVRRMVSRFAFVGIHQLKTIRTTAQVVQKFRIEKELVNGVPLEKRRVLVSEKLVNERRAETKTPEKAYEKVAAYFQSMGVGGPVMAILRGTPNSSIHWLSRAELTATGLATHSGGMAWMPQEGGR